MLDKGCEVLGVSLGMHSNVDLLKAEMEAALRGVREELDEHLETINQATDEVQSSQDFAYRLDWKIDRLSERLEKVILILKNSGVKVDDSQPESFELSDKEKAVFLVLYNSEGRMLAYSGIARALRESEFLVRSLIASMIQKGVPIRKRYINNEACLELDSRFREMQAKTNCLNISQKSVKEFC